MSTEFVSSTVDGLLEEFQQMMAELQETFLAKIQNAQEQGDYDAVASLSVAMQNETVQLTEDFHRRHQQLSERQETVSLYDQSACEIDLDLTVYDGDRDYSMDFAADPNIQTALQTIRENNPAFNSRKHLLKSSLKLTPVIAPQIYALGDRCKKILGLKADIQFFVHQDDRFNAACYPPEPNKLYIILSSGIIEKFASSELLFVIGHEIGHALFNHFRYPTGHILEVGKDYLSPLHAMKLFAWSRDAEISADRVGLMCCGDFEAAAKTFFKLSSGVTTDSLEFRLNEYIDQFVDLKSVLDDNGIDPEDWYSTHPFSPLRIKALELFNRSQTYQKLMGNTGGTITEEEMEMQIKQILSLMEPSYLSDESEAGHLIQTFIFKAGFLIALIDGEVDSREIQALGSLVNPELFTELVNHASEYSVEGLKDELASQSDRIENLLSTIQKLNMLRDLAIIASADERIDEREVDILYGLANLLRINPAFIDRVMNDIASAA